MSLSTSATPRATRDDLERTEGKAELVAGRIVKFPPDGYEKALIRGEIYSSLIGHAESIARGYAYSALMAFMVPELRSGRESFSPDVSFYDGPLPADERDFIDGPPTFAVEVRGKTAEREMAAKRADYFEAGTLVVWDVDPDAKCVHVYRAAAPDRPETFGAGQQADAEPAVPGWRLSVDEILQ